MKTSLLLIFTFFTFFIYGQAKIEMTKDNKLRVSGMMIYRDDSGKNLEANQFREMLNSRKYILMLERGNGDTLYNILRAKDPLKYVGKRIPPQTFQGINGDTIFTQKKGQVTVLTFWGDRCPPCITLIDSLDSLSTNYKYVDFIALATYGDVKQFYARHPWKHVRVVLEYKGEFDPYFPGPAVAIIDQYGVLRSMIWEYDVKKVVAFLDGLE